MRELVECNKREEKALRDMQQEVARLRYEQPTHSRRHHLRASTA